jgi:excinuclease ABC subunit A
MGPEGGSGGGTVVAEGTPEQIAEIDDSHTGRYLRAPLGRDNVRPIKRAGGRPRPKRAVAAAR